jgi:glycosyltransferase involved in cell wall biosynthesis
MLKGSSKAMKVLHCPTSVGGVAWTLSRAERKLGLQSDVMVFQSNWLAFPADIDLKLGHGTFNAVRRLPLFFFKAAKKYDVFHFNYGSSFLPPSRLPHFFELSDLPVLRALGKKIVVSYQGCDIRQKGFCTKEFAVSACHADNCQAAYCNDKTDVLKMKRAAKFERYAHKIFAATPDLLHWLPVRAEFLPVAQVDLNDWQPERQKREDNKLTLLHSPTDRGSKGTKYILEAIERLEGRYRDIELILVEGVSHAKVKDLYRKADLVIDQLLGGWYGGFAVEAMALGKPVVCYIREGDLVFIPGQMKEDLPIVNANPSTIYDVLVGLVEERNKLPTIGEKSRAYVERWHDPMKIAARTKEAYESAYRK